MRVCEDHLQAALSSWAASWVPLADVDGNADDRVCSACGLDWPRGGLVVAGFAWFYPKGQEPLELMNYTCEPCAAKLVSDLGLERQKMRSTAS